MITHIVLLWAREPEMTKTILEEAKKLAVIPTAKYLQAGLPIPSERPVVDSSYSVGISMLFDDAAGADAYQTHPLHKAFTENVVRKLVDKVRVYDFQ